MLNIKFTLDKIYSKLLTRILNLIDIDYLRTTMPDCVEPEFFEYLKNLTTDEVSLYAIEEGSVVFPRQD